MGLEVLAMVSIGLTAASIVAGNTAANQQTKAIAKQQEFNRQAAERNAKEQQEAFTEEGGLAARNKAQETVLRAARARVSFLSSGLTMDGTPRTAIEQMLDTGNEDVNQIMRNYSRRSTNAVNNIIDSATSQNMQLQGQAVGIVGKARADTIRAIAGTAMSFAGGGTGGGTENMGSTQQFGAGNPPLPPPPNPRF